MIDAGFRAEFATGYLQREIILHQCDVSNGIDESVHNSATKGFAVGRLVKVTKDSNGKYTITVPTTGVGKLTASSNKAAYTAALAENNGVGDATHIIAQSDNTIRDTMEDFIKDEKYDALVKNGTDKTVAVYAIVNADDIKLVQIGHPEA